MRTYLAILDEALLESGIAPSDFPEPLRALAMNRIPEFENAILQRTDAMTDEYTLQCESGKCVYFLPREIHAIESLSLNGNDITDCRVPASEIITGE